MNEVTPSKAIVAAMMAKNPKVKDRGFRAALRRIPSLAEAADLACFIPDAYVIDLEDQVITLIEVDDTNPIDEGKASKIGNFTDCVMGDDWAVRVVVIDYAGGVKAEVPGWAFMSVYTSTIVGPNCNDYTPAAAGIARMVQRRQDSPYSADDLADRL